MLPEVSPIQIKIKDSDLEWQTCKSGGSGGQHIQKTETAVQLKHIPSGIMVRVESRHQARNKEEALAILRAKLFAAEKEKIYTERSQTRKDMVGIGARGDKRRTIRQQDGVVTDHVLNRKTTWKAYSRGDWDDLLGV